MFCLDLPHRVGFVAGSCSNGSLTWDSSAGFVYACVDGSNTGVCYTNDTAIGVGACRSQFLNFFCKQKVKNLLFYCYDSVVVGIVHGEKWCNSRITVSFTFCCDLVKYASFYQHN